MNDIFILNSGCSFSAYAHKTVERPGNWMSYCTFLPGKVFNLATRGAGIETAQIMRFAMGYMQQNPDKHPLTHFVFQVPSPSRQVIYMDLIKKNIDIDVPITKTECVENFSQYVQGEHWQSEPNELKSILKEKTNSFFDNMNNYGQGCYSFLSQYPKFVKYIDHFYQRAINDLDKGVKFIREYWPEIKIIFLRYETTGAKFKRESVFTKDFYKNKLRDYCLSNEIEYIYEENFHTEWFRKNNLTIDWTHPNSDGAQVIANKIKEYL